MPKRARTGLYLVPLHRQTSVRKNSVQSVQNPFFEKAELPWVPELQLRHVPELPHQHSQQHTVVSELAFPEVGQNRLQIKTGLFSLQVKVSAEAVVLLPGKRVRLLRVLQLLCSQELSDQMPLLAQPQVPQQHPPGRRMSVLSRPENRMASVLLSGQK